MSESVSQMPLDRDFFQTQEGLIFCVTGHFHPPDRITAYLKYLPTREGKWQGRGQSFQRQLDYYHAKNVVKTIDFLKQAYPDYVSYCPVRNFEFSLVPRSAAAVYFRPRPRLAEILDHARDSLEQEAAALVRALSGASGVDVAGFGITGSILIGLHNSEWSDIDLLVYGSRNSRRVKRCLTSSRGIPGICQADGQGHDRWARRVSQRFPLSFDQARQISVNRWNYGYFNGRYFSIHPVLPENEITGAYGMHTFSRAGTARVEARVADNTRAVFLPAVYGVNSVHVIQGSLAGAGIQEIVSHEGIFRDLAGPGQRIEAQGSIETVDGRPWRLVIGTSGQKCPEYIRHLAD